MNKTNVREDGTTESENYWFNQNLTIFSELLIL
jgi:hypothetical protein